MDLQQIFANSWTWVTWIRYAGLILIFIFACYSYSEQVKRVKYAVKLNSDYYRKVVALNQKYNFHWNIPGNGIILFCEQETTKAKYDRRRLEDILYENIQERMLMIRQTLRNVDINRNLYSQYQSELSRLRSTITVADCERLNIPVWRFEKEEQILVASIIQNPIITLQARCEKIYRSPAGRNTYRSTFTFSEKTIQDTVVKVQEDAKRKSTESYRRKAERQRVTEKLRYQVMRRDGFRCQLCGATQADGVKLHVDHIIPVSKGGTSDIGNLRTLCDRCNRGKGDQFEF